MESQAPGQREALENDRSTLLPLEYLHDGRETTATEFSSSEAGREGVNCVASSQANAQPTNEHHTDTLGTTSAMNSQTYSDSSVDSELQESRPANQYHTDMMEGTSATNSQTNTDNCIDMNPPLQASHCQASAATDSQELDQKDVKIESDEAATSMTTHTLQSIADTVSYNHSGNEQDTGGHTAEPCSSETQGNDTALFVSIA